MTEDLKKALSLKEYYSGALNYSTHLSKEQKEQLRKDIEMLDVIIKNEEKKENG